MTPAISQDTTSWLMGDGPPYRGMQRNKLPSYFDLLLDKLESDGALWEIQESRTQLAIWPFIRHRVLFHLLYSRRKIDSIEAGHRSSYFEKFKSVLFAF